MNPFGLVIFIFSSQRIRLPLAGVLPAGLRVARAIVGVTR